MLFWVLQVAVCNDELFTCWPQSRSLELFACKVTKSVWVGGTPGSAQLLTFPLVAKRFCSKSFLTNHGQLRITSSHWCWSMSLPRPVSGSYNLGSWPMPSHCWQEDALGLSSLWRMDDAICVHIALPRAYNCNLNWCEANPDIDQSEACRVDSHSSLSGRKGREWTRNKEWP